MKWSKLLRGAVLGIALILAVGFGGVTGASALDKEHPEDVTLVDNNSCFTYVQVSVWGIARGMFPYGFDKQGNPLWDTRPTFFKQTGTGCVVHEQFIVTAAHVIIPQVVDTISGKSSIFRTRPKEVIDRHIFIYDYKSVPTLVWIHYIDEEQDIAILRFNNWPRQFEPIPYEWCTNTGWLQPGDAVTVVTRGRNDDGDFTWGCVEKKGHITYLGIDPNVEEAWIPWFSMWDVTMDVNIIPGDSGSPVFGYMNGVPVFIGVARAAYFDGYHYFSFFARLGATERYLDLTY